MQNIPVIVSRAQYLDDDGNPLSGGRVSYYVAGTSTLAEVYTDRAGNANATNPHVLNAGGMVRAGGVWKGPGLYKEVVEKAVSLPAPGEEPETVVVEDATYGGTYLHTGEDPNGFYIWTHETNPDYTINRHLLAEPAFVLNDPAAPGGIPASYRYVSLGMMGDWSKLGMTVGYSDYEVFWTQDNIPGADAPDPTASAGYVETIQNLRDLDYSSFGAAYVSGYYTLADGGEGMFRFNSTSSATDNGGTIFSPTGNPSIGRWIRCIEQEEITPAMFGSIPGDTRSVGGMWQQMINWVSNASPYRTIRIPGGTYRLNSNVLFNGANSTLIVDDGVYMTAPSVACQVSMTCAHVFINGRSPIVNPAQVTLVYDPFDHNNPYRPEWTYDGSGDYWDAFGRIASNSVGREVYLGKPYPLIGSEAGTVTIGRAVFEQGACIASTYGNRVVEIGSYRTIGEMADIFTGDAPSAVSLTEQTILDARHMSLITPGTVSAADLTRLASIATGDGAHSATLLWGGTTPWVFSESWDAGSTTNAPALDWEADAGSTLKFDGEVFIPRFTGAFRCINTTGSGSPRFGCPIDPRWFGAVSDTTTTAYMDRNVLALESAFAAAMVSYPSVLDGGGSTFHVNSTVHIADSLGYTSVSAKRLTIQPEGAFGANYVVISSATGSHTFHDLTINTAQPSLYLSGAAGVSLWWCSFGGDVQSDGAGVFESVNCLFADELVASDAASVQMRGSALYGNSTLSGTSGDILGNSVSNCIMKIRDPAEMRIKQNSFIATAGGSPAQLRLEGSLAGWVTTGLVVTDNFLDSKLAGVNYVGITGRRNMAAGGHLAYVGGNRVAGGVWASGTHVLGTGSYAWNNSSNVSGGTCGGPGYYAQLYVSVDPEVVTTPEEYQFFMPYVEDTAWGAAAVAVVYAEATPGVRYDQPLIQLQLSGVNLGTLVKSYDLSFGPPATNAGPQFNPPA